MEDQVFTCLTRTRSARFDCKLLKGISKDEFMKKANHRAKGEKAKIQLKQEIP